MDLRVDIGLRGRRTSPRGVMLAVTLAAVFGLWGTAVLAYGASASKASASKKTHWVNVASPDAGVLYGVSCSSPSFCMAVGFADNGADQVAETWNGHAWKSVTPTAPAGSSSALLKSVSCTSPHACVAVGGYEQGSDYLPLVERWNGSSWAQLAAASVGTVSSFSAVACPRSGDCWAVGSIDGEKSLAEHSTGAGFSIVSTVTKGQDAQLNGISCRSGSCVAVGGNSSGAVIERSTGKSFTNIAVGKTPKGTIGDLWSIDCVSSRYCLTTGESDAAKGGAIQTLTEVDAGKRFTTVSSPDPTHLSVPYNSLYGVTCTSSKNCWAAGEGGAYAFGGPNLSSKDRSTIAAHWNGRAWTLASSVNPGNKPTGFLDVSCSRATSCMATGLREPSGEQQTLVEALRP